MLAALIIEALIIGALLVFVYVRDRQVALERKTEREEWMHERQLLLNRIKPETAQVLVREEQESYPSVSEFDDEEFWKAKETELQRLAGIS